LRLRRGSMRVRLLRYDNIVGLPTARRHPVGCAVREHAGCSSTLSPSTAAGRYVLQQREPRMLLRRFLGENLALIRPRHGVFARVLVDGAADDCVPRILVPWVLMGRCASPRECTAAAIDT
jgi:hypothetical protein